MYILYRLKSTCGWGCFIYLIINNLFVINFCFVAKMLRKKKVENVSSFSLQVDPKKRVTIKQLLSHEWMMKGYAAPVRWISRIKVCTFPMLKAQLQVKAEVNCNSVSFT